MRFRDWLVTKIPPLLQVQASLATFARAVGDTFDAMEFKADQAIKQRFPQYTSRGGLSALANERGLPRPLNATDAQHAAKLKDAWNLWPEAGTPFGLLRALTDEGYSVTLLTKRGNRYTLSSSGTGYDRWLGDSATFGSWAPAFWNRFAVYIRPTFPSGAVPTQTSGEGQTLLNIIAKWKSAHGFPAQVVWVPSDLTWDGFPSGATWDAQGRATWDSNLATSTAWSF
jgi:hypothetical protein